MFRRQAVAAALLVGMTGGAFAADAVVEEVVVVETGYDWSGIYLGVQGGYAFSGDGELSYPPDTGFYPVDLEGGFGGVQLGYNQQFSNNIVLGVETDIVFGDLEGDGTFQTSQGPDAVFTAQGELKWVGSTRLRAGYAVDRWLPFATVGVAYGEFEAQDAFNGNPEASGDATLTGWTAGGGLNFAVTDSIIIGGEYRYTDFGSKSFDVSIGDLPSGDMAIDLKTHDIRFSASYKF